MAKKKVVVSKKPASKKQASKKQVSQKKKKPGHKKFEIVMKEFEEGKLHSGSKKGPKVKKVKQAIAIALSESKKATRGRKK